MYNTDFEKTDLKSIPIGRHQQSISHFVDIRGTDPGPIEQRHLPAMSIE